MLAFSSPHDESGLGPRVFGTTYIIVALVQGNTMGTNTLKTQNFLEQRGGWDIFHRCKYLFPEHALALIN